MPPKPLKIRGATPDWAYDLYDTDPCLFEIVMEALVARFVAIESGAESFPACEAALRSADTTLAQIRDGRVRGREAWRKAAVAVRKYNTAAECARPTATRYSRKKRSAKR